jgi:hypothetical protein
MRFSILAGAILAFLLSPVAEAAVQFSFQEAGGNVVGTVSGSLDLTGATMLGVPGGSQFTSPGAINPFFGAAGFGSGLDTYSSSSVSFGINLMTTADSSSGAGFGVSSGRVFVPGGYAGEALTGTVSFINADFASLGVTPGTYVISLPDDTVTVSFGSAVVPLPATLPLLLGAVGLSLAAARRRA